MRLTSIRLAGFKSFVDPTTLTLTSNLTGVVGPNGCGKSNVIDAVRWVTGESSARQLRGEALEDVIFNGSRARKPVGRASVELRFDNSEGKLAGQYGAYLEISIKRELTRDGGSRYFINGTKSRRRDVIDLFLGTGLGGRSNYAVIEQGAVNRLIEARPEDMRQVLEEAAGISKYKERRRETENRIRHTRENLERLDDLIGEVTQRLGVLKRQSANAEKYKQFKVEERRLRADLLALRWRAYDSEVKTAEQGLRDIEQTLRQAVSTQRDAQAGRDTQSRDQQQAMDRVQTQQAAFYDARAKASRIDQAMAHAREMQQMRERERSELAGRADTLAARIAEDRDTCAQLDQAITDAEREHEREGNNRDQAAQALAAADTTTAEAEAAWDRHNNAEHNPVQRLDAERRRLTYADEQREQLARRHAKRRQEREGLAPEASDDLEAGDREIEARAARLAADETRATGLRETDESLAAAIAEARRTVDRQRTEIAETRARLASDRRMQQSVLREDDSTLAQWLETNGLGHAAGIARRVKVDPAWQTAVEAVLGEWLRGFLVDHLPDGERDWPADSLVLIESDDMNQRDASALPVGPDGEPCLASGLNAPPVVRALARRYFVVDTLAEALSNRHGLAADQRYIARDGFCVGPHSLTTPADESAERGVLEREQRIDRLSGELDAAVQVFDAEQDALENQQSAHRDTREQRQALEQSIVEQRRALEAARAAQQGRRMQAEQVSRRTEELDAEIADLEHQIAEIDAERERLGTEFSALEQAAEAFSAARREARQTLAAARDARERARAENTRAEQTVRDIASRIEQLTTRRDSLSQRIEDSEKTAAELRQRLAAFETETDSVAATAYSEDDHQAAREAQQTAERALRSARETLKACEQALEKAGETVMQAEQGVETARERLQQAKIDVETADARRAGITEQIEALEQTPQALVAELADEASVEAVTAEIESLERKIQRLGAINLAAIEEYDAEAEREAYLQDQHRDLSEALETLERAIAKIDRETRARFKATFEQVNGRFAEMFPELFGGGEAALELTEDDWLATGIRVMARPPGKRNASIQMLSGGEKALTAVALLFALFELNPAPFCMLDEIDAPLDDANVSRFCELVRRMSARVQFIVITHNKLTMSLAEQLHGVTMAEPGVSRLVSVDIEQALDMAG